MKKFTWVAVSAVVIVAGISGFRYLSGDAPASGSQGAAGANLAGKPAAEGRRGGGRPAPLVVTSEVSEKLINDRLKAIGNGAALASVSVVPLSGGILTGVLVRPGQRVEAGETLATLDAEEQQIARDRAAREAEEAEADAIRLEQLFRSRTTTRVELNRARAALTDAQLALRDAELKLTRRTITAPMAGIVGFVSVDSGNYITAQTELMTIDDRSKLIVEFWVPERFANQISLGQTVNAVAMADPGTNYEGIIDGIGSRIERDSRTLPVKAVVDNIGDTLRPGMSFELLLNFPGQSFSAIDPLAIQWDSSGSFAWRIIDDKAQRVAARIIQRNPEAVLVDSELKPGDMVVTEGVLSVRQGASVRVEGAPGDARARGNGNNQDGSRAKPGNKPDNAGRDGSGEKPANAGTGSDARPKPTPVNNGGES